MYDIYIALNTKTFETIMQGAICTNQKKLVKFISEAERKQYRINKEDVLVFHSYCDIWRHNDEINLLKSKCLSSGGDFIRIGEDWDDTEIEVCSEYITLEQCIICKPNNAQEPVVIGNYSMKEVSTW